MLFLRGVNITMLLIWHSQIGYC